ncbi:MAG: hypothetical protein ACRDJE_04255 [Dehalococcoidia bacterium]
MTKQLSDGHDWAIALTALPRSGALDDVFDLVFDGWGEEYGAGRTLLLSRLRSFRGGQGRDHLRPVAEVLYRTLITFGEETGDMRFVHLAVECWDALIHEQ